MYRWLLASRYLLKRRITWFAVLAVMLCVFIVVVVMTVLTGLVRDFTAKNHEFVGDVVVGTESLVGFAYYEGFLERLGQADFVAATSPVVKSYALISPADSDRNIGVEVMGIDLALHCRVTGFAATLHYHAGDWPRAFEPAGAPDLPGCILGIDLALDRDRYGRYNFGPSIPRISLAVTCFPLTARGALALAGTSVATTKTFHYSDTSQSGLARVDSAMIYLPIEPLQAMCGMDGPTKRITAIHVKLADGVKVPVGREKIAALWDRYKAENAQQPQAHLLETVRVQGWKENRRSFIAAMEKEQTMMTALFGLVGITAVFIVFVVFYMIISNKTRDIGVLKSVGVSSLNVVRLFMGFAFCVGAIGSLLGMAGGLLFLRRANQIEGWLFEHFGFQIWDRSLYVIGDIPNQAEPRMLVVIAAMAVLACLAGALIPSGRAARLRPVDTLTVARL